MSYILDALKKAEQARLNVDTPLQQLLLRGEEAPREPRRVWPYVAGAVLLLNAAALYVWWRAQPGAEVAREAQPANPVKLKPAAAQPAPIATQPGDAAPGGAQTGASLADILIARRNPLPQPPAAMPPMAPSPAAAVQPPVTPRPAPQPSTTTSPATRAASGPATATGAPPVASVPGKEVAGESQASDLPEAIRRELPPLVVSGTMREMGSAGWVVVNERAFREGEEVAPGLRVEKILERGAQFSYKGFRFQR